MEVEADAATVLRVAAEYGDELDLLFADVVIPGMNGRELSERLLAHRPDLPVLFTSGYPGPAIGRRGIAEDPVAYIEKPYEPDELAARIREALDGSRPSSD